MKSKWTKSSIPSFLSCRTTVPRFERRISGYVLSCISFWYAFSEGEEGEEEGREGGKGREEREGGREGREGGEGREREGGRGSVFVIKPLD